MATHDYNIANAAGATVRSDINNCFSAIHSNNASATTPGTVVAHSTWPDTTNNIFKLRNGADNAWYSLFDTSTGELLANLGNGLKVNSGDSGATAHPDADEFIVEGGGSNAGISILTSNSGVGRLYFGHVSDSQAAYLAYVASTTTWYIATGATGATMELGADNGVTNVTLSGASGSELCAVDNDCTVAGDHTVSGKTAMTGGVHKTTHANRTAKTISGGTITIDENDELIAIAPESGSTDDLTEINGGTTGQEITILANSLTNTITVKHNTGIGGDFLANQSEADVTIKYHIHRRYRFDADYWHEI